MWVVKIKQHISSVYCLISRMSLMCLFRSEWQIAPGSHSSLPFLTTLWESLNELNICVCMNTQMCALRLPMYVCVCVCVSV